MPEASAAGDCRTGRLQVGGGAGRTRRLGTLAGLLGLGLGLAACAGTPPPDWDALALDVKPLDGGRLTSRFGWREYHPLLRRPAFHQGVDWSAPRGTGVRAAADGTVVAVQWWGGYGNYLRVDHIGAVQTVYAHLATFAPGMVPGRRVRRGDLIGWVGSTGRATGPHLHFELRVAGEPVNPLAAGRGYALASATRR